MTRFDPIPAQAAEADAQTAGILEVLIRGLVDHPKAVKIGTLSADQATIFEVTVGPEDVRRVIGRRGRTATAVRELLQNLGAKAGRRYHLEILEPTFRMEEVAGVAGLGVPVKVERVVGPRLDVSAHHED